MSWVPHRATLPVKDSLAIRVAHYTHLGKLFKFQNSNCIPENENLRRWGAGPSRFQAQLRLTTTVIEGIFILDQQNSHIAHTRWLCNLYLPISQNVVAASTCGLF